MFYLSSWWLQVWWKLIGIDGCLLLMKQNMISLSSEWSWFGFAICISGWWLQSDCVDLPEQLMTAGWIKIDVQWCLLAPNDCNEVGIWSVWAVDDLSLVEIDLHWWLLVTAEDGIDMYDQWMILVWWRMTSIGGLWITPRLDGSACTVYDPWVVKVDLNDLHWWLLMVNCIAKVRHHKIRPSLQRPNIAKPPFLCTFNPWSAEMIVHPGIWSKTV